jgi:glycerophosphoryl diester phosphodiesterase
MARSARIKVYLQLRMFIELLNNRKGASAPFFILILCAVQLNAQSLKDQLKKEDLILCAHRGGMYADYAENSLKTLEYLGKSFEGSSVMAEVDVRKSKDGTLFLLHDNTLERTTTGTGKIEESTDDYLRSLKLRNGKGDVLDETIPTLAELLDFVAKRKIFLMLDVKIDDWKAIMDLVKSKKAVQKCLVLTFKAGNSKKAHELSPDMLVSCLVKDQNDLNEISKIVPKKVMMAYVNKSTPADVIQELKNKKIFLVSDASEVERNNGVAYDAEFYKSIGVNVLVTDLPREVKALLR